MEKMQAIYFLILESGNLFVCRGMVVTSCQLITVKGTYSIGGREYPKFDHHQGWLKKSEANKYQLEAIRTYEKTLIPFLGEETSNWVEPEKEEHTSFITGQHMVSQMFNSSIYKGLFD